MEMSLVRNQTSLQNFGYWIKYTTARRLRTLFVLKCLDFYLGICLQDVGKGSLLQDVCLMTWFLCLYLWNILPLLTYFIMRVAFLSSNLAIGRKGCLWVFFVMKPWLVIQFVYYHFTILSQWFPCFFFWIHPVFHALLLCTLYDSIWSCNWDIVQDSGLRVMHRWTTN